MRWRFQDLGQIPNAYSQASHWFTQSVWSSQANCNFSDLKIIIFYNLNFYTFLFSNFKFTDLDQHWTRSRSWGHHRRQLNKQSLREKKSSEFLVENKKNLQLKVFFHIICSILKIFWTIFCFNFQGRFFNFSNKSLGIIF